MKTTLFTALQSRRSRGWRPGMGVLCGLIAIMVWLGPGSGPIPGGLAATANPSAREPLSNETFIAVAQSAKDSVVNIASIQKLKSGQRFFDPFSELFRRFFGEEFERRFPIPRERREQGLGSGVIVSADGYILTNNHVVEQAEDIQVLLPDKRSFKAKVIGTDPKTDLAVIKVEASHLPTLPWGDSSRLQAGEVVLAVGNPFGLNQTVTMGIVSAVGRAQMGIVDYEDFIQTDAAINPGNSGGALVNLKGELIGINTAIFSQSGGFMGIGFAIPSKMAKSVMDSLIKHGKVVRGWIGVAIQELTPDLAREFDAPDTNGALVSDVLEDSPAAKAGLLRGDIIRAYNQSPVKDPTQLRTMVAETPPGTTVTLSVLRDKREREVKVAVGELPKELAKVPRRGGPEERMRGEHALGGVTVEDVSAEAPGRRGRPGKDSGVVVVDVEPGTPADRAGLRPGDIIREINRKPVRTSEDFERLVDELKPNERVLLLLNRGNVALFLTITPEQ